MSEGAAMKTSKLTLVLMMTASALLAACGGGGGGFEAPPAAPAGIVVPPNATASVANFVNFVDTLRPSETADPLDIGSVTPPTSETDDPLSVT